MPALTLVRHATLRLELGGEVLLVDPMLGAAGSAPPVPGTAPDRPNPLVKLPMPVAEVVAEADAVLQTHLHEDHLDAAAREHVPRDLPWFCAPADLDALRGHGLADVIAVEEQETTPGGLEVHRVPAVHTLGEHVEALGPGSGWVLRGGGPTVYVAGDCVWCESMAATLDRFRPDVVVLNAGAARFLTGAHITMTTEDVIAAARHAPQARVVAVHLEAINHCAMSRAELRRHAVGAGIADRLVVPEDGERVAL